MMTMMKNGNWKIKGKYVEAKIGFWNLEFSFSCFVKCSFCVTFSFI